MKILNESEMIMCSGGGLFSAITCMVFKAIYIVKSISRMVKRRG